MSPGQPRVVAQMLPVAAFAIGATMRSIEPDRRPVEAICILGIVLLGLLYWHRYRGLGLAAFAWFAAFVTGLVAAGMQEWTPATRVLAIGFLSMAFLRAVLYLSSTLTERTQLKWALLLLGACFAAFLAGSAIGGTGLRKWQPPPYQFLWLPATAGLLALLSLVFLFRPIFEFVCEPILWVMYRIRGAGSGMEGFPRHGPCIVVANHACWFDPLFLAKVLPRPITPMMTSRFYDKPLLRPLLKLFHTIRVPDKHIKRQETPDEVREAIAALDRGDCLVLFPEGFLRRSDDKPLKRFGRGVWQILSARPNTPVFCCWIEGAWGSYFSYWNGPPTKNKKRDFRRWIGVGVPAPIRVEPEMLAHHLTTRIFLMNQVLESRGFLGLPELPAFELPKGEDEQPDTASE